MNKTNMTPEQAEKEIRKIYLYGSGTGTDRRKEVSSFIKNIVDEAKQNNEYKVIENDDL